MLSSCWPAMAPAVVSIYVGHNHILGFVGASQAACPATLLKHVDSLLAARMLTAALLLPIRSPAGGRQVRSDPATLLGRLGRLLLRIVLWGSAKVQQLLWRLRWLIYANGMFVALLIAIHWASPDPHLASFPAACPPGTRFGCSRVTEAAPHGARRLRPLALPGSVEGVQGAARGWVEQQTHARVLLEQPGFLHARFVSFFWGFADDFIVGVRCETL